MVGKNSLGPFPAPRKTLGYACEIDQRSKSQISSLLEAVIMNMESNDRIKLKGAFGVEKIEWIDHASSGSDPSNEVQNRVLPNPPCGLL